MDDKTKMKDRKKDNSAQGTKRERLAKRGKVRAKKVSKFSTVEHKQTMRSVQFFNIYNYNNNNSSNNNINNNHNSSNNHN